MKYRNVFILMYKNFEVLSFNVNYKKHRVKVIKKLEHFDKAPNKMIEAEDSDSLDMSLLRLINHLESMISKIYPESLKSKSVKIQFK